MTKRLTAKYSICKKIKSNYKNLWGFEEKEFFRSLLAKRKQKTTPFSKLLNIKQTLKFFYCNIRELSFKKYILYSVKSQSKTIDKLLSILESRIDTLLFRSCFVTSFHEARQYINHRFVFVNNFSIISPNTILAKGDIVQLKTNKCKIVVFETKNFKKKLLSRSLPNYIEVDMQNFLFIFLWDISFQTSFFPVDLFYQNVSRYYK